MFDFDKIPDDYIKNLVEFLHSVKWMFCVLNTQYINQDIITENRIFLDSLDPADLNDFPELKNPQNHHKQNLQHLIEQVNRFKISFETVITESWKATPVKKLKLKKQYEIENVSKVIHAVCQDEDTQLVDFGCGLGYLSNHLHENYGYRVLGLESCEDRVEKARERLKKFHPAADGKVRYEQEFITTSSADFILSKIDPEPNPIAIFGLHGCGDLTVTAIQLFLTMPRVKKLIFMPCCYHKMSCRITDDASEIFDLFPLSEELAATLSSYPPFMNRPFLRLAGQQSPAKWKEMSRSDHWIHGKNMFERALVEAVIEPDETTKRFNNVTFPDDRVSFEDIKLKYQLLDKSSGNSKEWSATHENRFEELRRKFYDGEEVSEKIFCLQTTIQSVCENLVLVDRIRYIQEQGREMRQEVSVSVKKLQDDKLTPRCLILIARKI